ncbi:aldo/keto reductase [Tenuifilum osseticum]|uniref:aldo/keto reductase n=1 Tax=Tenuifilum osseticum TaxID=3374723 RepID=UPI0034E6164A
MRSDRISLSPLVWGHWRLPEWNLSQHELLYLTQQCIDIGITTIDSADIYGNYSCEKLFGDALALKPEVRNQIQIVTKCGIRLISERFPDVTTKHYDYSYDHIVSSVEQSLKNFRTDRIDLLLLHRPSPLLNPEEVATAFNHLKSTGKVLHFGVSNFLPHQTELLQSFLNIPLEVNQIEVSPLQLEHLHNGNLDYLMQKRIIPMAWSPLGGGSILNPKSETEKRIAKTIHKISEETNLLPEQVAISWLVTHPAGIIPVVGSGKFERIKNAFLALKTKLTTQQWFQVYSASIGKEVP